MNDFYSELADTFNYSDLISFLSGAVPKIIMALLIFFSGYIIWKLLSFLLKLSMKRSSVDNTAQTFIQMITKYIILAIAIVMALDKIGVNTASLLTSLGIAGLTIGFAARDALSNIISGLFIFWDRPFVIGDLVEVGGNYGTVERITLRSTRVVTVDGRMLAIPNTEVVNSTVSSFTNFPNLRLDVPVTISVDEDISRARQLLLDIIKNDPRYKTDPAPVVVVNQLNDYNVELKLQAWIEDERRHIPMKYELRENIFNTLRDAGVNMPYETFALTPVEIKNN